MLSTGAILSTMTSQGQQNALQKGRPRSHGTMETLYIDSSRLLHNKSDFSFGANMTCMYLVVSYWAEKQIHKLTAIIIRRWRNGGQGALAPTKL